MSNPTYKLGDANTQIYRDSNNKTVLTNNGLDVINISGLSTENVMDFFHNTPVINLQSTNTSVTAHSTIRLGITGGDNWDLSAGISGIGTTGTSDSGYNFHIQKNNVDYMTILDNNNVGIGITTPEYLLDVGGGVQIRNDLVVQGNIFIKGVSADNGELGNIWNSLSNDVYSVFSGNYGIGTTTPGSKLEVIGDIGVSGNIVPLITETFDLGTTTSKFKDLYLSGNTIFLGDAQISTSGSTTNFLEIGVTNNINTSAGVYQINSNNVLTSDTLGTGVTQSSLETVGDLTSLNLIGNISINSNNVLTNDTLGTGVTQSSLEIVGSLSSLDIIGNLTLGTTGFVVDSLSTGNVGIGLTPVSSANNLHIHENSSSTSIVRFTNNTTGTGSTNGSTVGLDTGENLAFVNFDPTDILFYTDTTRRMRILSTGEVGIGTDTPLQLLSVSGNILSSHYDSSGIEIIPLDTELNGGGRIFYREGNDDTYGFSVGFNGGNTGSEILNWATNTFNITRHNGTLDGVPTLTIKRTDGFMGIGVTNPSVELDIAGDVNISGDLAVVGSMGLTLNINGPKMWCVNVATSYIIASQNSGIANIMDDWIQFEDDTITWLGIVLIQDDNASADILSLKVSKNSVAQTIDTADTELGFLGPAQNTNMRVAFVNSFTSVQDDILRIELKSDDAGTTEEFAIFMYGIYSR